MNTSLHMEQIREKTELLIPELKLLSKSIYDEPELGNEEFKSAQKHMTLLKKYGFEVIQPYLGVETGFKAIYKAQKEGPTIAYLCEYDALPGIGHGCGHNILGTTSTGAGLILRSIIEELGGTVIVFGTPAEETSGAKVKYADEGAFDDVDIALVAHPNSSYNRSGKSLAMEAIQFDYHGKTSHAAAAPEKGINALDAVINTFNNINALRQQTATDARIHGVIKEGGKAANIIPEHAMVQFYVRAQTKTYLNELVKKVKACAEGASMAAGTSLEISNYEYSYDNLVTNETLSQLFVDQLEIMGITDISGARDSFGSLDAGNVSHKCPTIHPYFDIVGDPSIAAHTRKFAESTLTDYAYENMQIVICALVLTAVNVIENKVILDQIKAEFDAQEK
ncbi:M20 family metallopeptidase [Fusibacter sp. 3D3]|uniref:M20 family metallopeptidase n=1 Tax=Fusibacter sp. 3D3 TaxID=1048380 RepID=UPI000858F147|nr:M20 family metallopeptidase [Fusibacter sp. 3D3]GAU77838.1 catalyzes the cleavage of p-aminobenzoyl-glutamate to p-aminobenzoate and glutamate subunit A [Fusibacter sp. 3D3]